MPERDKENKQDHFLNDGGRVECHINSVLNLLPMQEESWPNLTQLCEQGYADVRDWGINDRVKERVEAEERRQLRSSIRRYTSSKDKL